MSQPFLNRLKRDLAASPAKSAVLGVLMIGGIGVWVYRLTSTPETAVVPPVPSSTTASVTAAPPAADRPHAKSSEGKRSWQQLAAWAESDPLLAVSPEPLPERDPFVDRVDNEPILAELAPDEPEPPMPTAAPAEEEPAAAADLGGVVLSSTVIGRTTRAAMINRRLYFQGTDVVIDGRTFRLQKVSARSVVLDDGQREYELKIPTLVSTPVSDQSSERESGRDLVQ